MPSTFQSADSMNAGGVSVLTLTFLNVTLTGSNRNIAPFVGHSAGTERSVTGIIRGADVYAHQASFKQDLAKGEVWNSTNEPQLAGADLAATINSANGTWGFSYTATENVHQVNRISTPVRTQNGSTLSLSVDVPSAVDDLVVSGLILRASSDPGPVTITGTNHTLRASSTNGTNDWHRMGTKPGEASATVGYSWANLGTAVLYGWNHPAAALTTVPDAPTVAATPLSPTSIHLAITSGNDHGSAILDTHIERRSPAGGGVYVRVHSTGNEATEWIDTGRTPNTQYEYQVISQNAVGESAPSIADSATTQFFADNAQLATLSFLRPFMHALPVNQATIDQATMQQLLHGLRSPLYSNFKIILSLGLVTETNTIFPLTLITFVLTEEDLIPMFFPKARVEWIAGDKRKTSDG